MKTQKTHLLTTVEIGHPVSNYPKIIAILTFLMLAALACVNLGTEATASEPTAPAPTVEILPTGDNPPPAGEGDAASDGEPTPTESTAPIDEADPPAEGPSEVLNLDDPAFYMQPEGIESYRTTLDFTFEAPGPVIGSVHLDSATQVEPYATTLEFFTGGRAVMGNNEVFTFTQILDTQYIVYSGFGCQSGTPGLQENPFAVMLDTGGMLTGEAQFFGEETVNGVAAYAYTLTMDNIDPNDPAGAGVITLNESWIYVAKDGGYVVRVRLVGQGRNELLSGDSTLVGDIVYELNYLDFNQPVNVQIPRGCTSEGNAEFKYPVPDDVVNLTDLGGMTGFNTGLDINAAIEFYKTEMAALGCSAPQEIVAVPAATLAFPCPDGTVNVLLAPGDSGGTAITIFETP